jgi:hypothetical protein
MTHGGLYHPVPSEGYLSQACIFLVIELGQANRGIIEFDYDNPRRRTRIYRFRMDGII